MTSAIDRATEAANDTGHGASAVLGAAREVSRQAAVPAKEVEGFTA